MCSMLVYYDFCCFFFIKFSVIVLIAKWNWNPSEEFLVIKVKAKIIKSLEFV